VYAAAKGPEDVACKVFVGGIPFEASEGDLLAHFGRYNPTSVRSNLTFAIGSSAGCKLEQGGTFVVTSCFVRYLQANVILDRDTSQSRGFGFVSFGDPQTASEAMRGMHNSQMGSRQVSEAACAGCSFCLDLCLLCWYGVHVGRSCC
jgi:RNA recognition motif-containing protein